MFNFVIFICLLYATFPPVLSCESDCQSGIAAAFIENYSPPIQRVFRQLATEISRRFSLDIDDPQYLLEPINNTFYITAPEFYGHEIFPSYFHGKCQNPTTGINPPGCPNPSCPVICGTPGSLVYHYSDLEAIVHNATKANYEQTIDPDAETFSETLSRVLSAMDSGKKPRPRPPLRYSRVFSVDFQNSWTTNVVYIERSRDCTSRLVIGSKI